MTCESFSELCELYVLGLLDEEDRRAANEHLQTGCPICSKSVERALSLNAMISANVPQAEPSPTLRRRIVESVGTRIERKRAFTPWLVAAAATLVLAVGLSLDYSYRLRQSAEFERQEARFAQASQILEASETRTVHFGEAAGAPHGAIYVNGRLGIVLATAGLPEIPKGWHYESWTVPVAGNPRAAGALETNVNGLALTAIPGPIDNASVHAVAVSLEPPGATLAKPTKVVFAVPL
jgi:anti-sigma-K factor RskA